MNHLGARYQFRLAGCVLIAILLSFFLLSEGSDFLRPLREQVSENTQKSVLEPVLGAFDNDPIQASVNLLDETGKLRTFYRARLGDTWSGFAAPLDVFVQNGWIRCLLGIQPDQTILDVIVTTRDRSDSSGPVSLTSEWFRQFRGLSAIEVKTLLEAKMRERVVSLDELVKQRVIQEIFDRLEYFEKYQNEIVGKT